MNENDVEKAVLSLLAERLHINCGLLIRENYDVPLTGRKFGLCARDLVYLFFEIEKYFGMRIMPEKLLDRSLCTISGIIEMLNKGRR